MLFDAAHLCGMIAGKAWPQPLEEGAHLITMSTYKSLGGPAGGLIVTDDAELAERLDAIAYPGLTANFDAGKTAALAMTMLDWKAAGPAYAREMIATARRLADGAARPRRPDLRRRAGRAPGRTSSPCLPTATAAASGPPGGCARRTCSAAASACRWSRSRAT